MTDAALGRPSPVFRKDYKATAAIIREVRDVERIREQYLLETALANRLRNAPPNQRVTVYGEVYDELFAFLQKASGQEPHRTLGSDTVRWGLDYLISLLKPESVFLEIGCGDGVMSIAVAEHVKQVFGLDVTDKCLQTAKAPANFQFLRSPDGSLNRLPDNSVDVAFSEQMMEHLHPDDAVGQLKEIHRVLKPGGIYRCSTPSRHTGPHDISCYFDYIATGLHLREYDYPSIVHLFREAGFDRPLFLLSVRGRQIPIPYPIGRIAEITMDIMPRALRAKLARTKLMRALAGINVQAMKLSSPSAE
jgi:2-polyprenyl-3-methyl-5-hydroxy-6-metoxy-1,4-benzoquinol methylase